MRVLSAQVENFGSYQNLEFTFTNQGLTLISGPTGSGKSTLCDVIPWILFGTTAKNGSADEVRSWSSSECTSGSVYIDLGYDSLCIRRQRNPNDLYYALLKKEGYLRGKDLNDTQKQINQLLNMSAETYLAGSYLHEFSQTSQFFTTSAKNRRSITEQLADFSLPKSLQEKISAYSKELKKESEQLKREIDTTHNTLAQLEKTLRGEKSRSAAWEKSHEETLKDIQHSYENYDLDRGQALMQLNHEFHEFELDKSLSVFALEREIKELESKIKSNSSFLEKRHHFRGLIEELQGKECKECGAPKNFSQIQVLERELNLLHREETKNKAFKTDLERILGTLSYTKSRINPYNAMIKAETIKENTWLQHLELKKLEKNPHLPYIESSLESYTSEGIKLVKTNNLLEEIKVEVSDIELILSTVNDLRGTILTNTINFLQQHTNVLLEDHFDAEIRITLSIADADKLDIEIAKDGNSCSYAQLSKGQRQLLKLCFGVSVMKAVSNYSGVNFNCLFFDEALDGMDDNIKSKSFTLLEKLSTEYESIFCVEHSENFKSLFINKYEVELKNGTSQIKKA